MYLTGQKDYISNALSTAKENYKLQAGITVLAVILFSIKLYAYFITGSLSILTDALESIANIAAGFVGLYSLYISSKPSDNDHPYGHGKIEYISAGIEGTFVIVAGIYIIYMALMDFNRPAQVAKLDIGLFLIAGTGIINFIVGMVSVKTGKKNNSLQLIAAGKHLKTDTYTSLGIFIGLILMYFTGWQWLDSLIATIFACIIIFTGYRIIRTSIAGIMDEADVHILDHLVSLLNAKRKENWIDIHNLRIIKYGSKLHCDCHLTLPWYLNLNEAHAEIDSFTEIIRNEFGEAVEFFIHSDGCKEFSCRICNKKDCLVRKHPFEKKLEWTVTNISDNTRHTIAS